MATFHLADRDGLAPNLSSRPAARAPLSQHTDQREKHHIVEPYLGSGLLCCDDI